MLKSVFVWYILLCKRLLKKISFILILVLIPIFSLLISFAAKSDGSFVKVALSADDNSDPIASELIHNLSENTNFISFEVYGTANEAVNAVEQSEADTAWVFPDDMSARIFNFAHGDRETLARVYVKEDDMLVKASREKLFGALYDQLSYEIYKKFVFDLKLDPSLITEEKLAQTYDVLSEDDGIIAFEFSDSTPIDLDSYNYTTAPMRGLLVTVMVLCGLAATLFYLDDEKRHTFANLSSLKRFAVFVGNNLAAVSIASVFVFVAILFSGNFTTFTAEVVALLLLVLMVTVFTVFLGCISRSSSRVGIMIPVILVLSLVLCPIFFNFKPFEIIQSMLPQYLYLYSIGDICKYILPMILYVISALPLSFFIFRLRKR